MVKYRYKEFKSVLNKLKYPDSWFWARYTLNAYSGCAHACIYCDARSQRYYLEDFENEVIIKTNFDKKLDQRFKRARTLLPDIIAPGGVNDAYQPIEQKIEHSRKVLQVIAKYKFPINIATKSKLVVRDIDILKEIAKKTWSTVGFSISTLNEELATFLEPHSSSPSERLKALHTIKQKAPEIQVGIYFMPIIPFLEDDDVSLEDIIKQSKKAGAEFVLFAPGLTFRDAQAQFFIKKLKNSKYSNIIKPLLELYKGRTNPPANYVRKFNLKLYNLCKEYKLAVRVRRWIPNDYREWNYKISEILLNKEYIDAITTGKSNNNMKWAGLNLNNLDVSIIDMYNRDELLKLKNFSRGIIEFVKPILEKIKMTHPKTTLKRFIN
ncbi:MAG: radical SAM protein [Candidatus Odinarchaeota archaeon]